MPNNGYFDLSSIFDIQQNQIVDLSNSYVTGNAPQLVLQVNELQKKLSSLSRDYDKANTSSDAIITEQNRMKAIVDTEHQRLLEKQTLIDSAQAEQERKALLNTTYRKKYAQYSKITIVVSMTLLGVIVITLLSRHITVFPQPVYSFITTCIIAIGIIYVIVLYADMSARDNINYDEIVIPPPKIDASGNLITSSSGSNAPNIWKAFKGCNGSQCCAPGTKWNDNLKLCVPDFSKSKTSSSESKTSSSESKTPSSESKTSSPPSVMNIYGDIKKNLSSLSCSKLNREPIKSAITRLAPYLNNSTLANNTSEELYKQCMSNPSSFNVAVGANKELSCRSIQTSFKDKIAFITGCNKNTNPGRSTTSNKPRGTTTSKRPGAKTSNKPRGTTTSRRRGTTTSRRPGTTTSRRPGTTTSSRPGTTTSSRPGTTTSSRPGTTTSNQPGTTTSNQPGTTTSNQPGTTTSKGPNGFTTLTNYMKYGDNTPILHDVTQNTWKQYWMGSTENTKPNVDSRFNDFARI